VIDVLLVGFGRFGREHFLAWEGTGRARVVGIVDPHVEPSEVTSPDGKRSIPLFRALHDLPNRLRPDAAAIVTPSWTHREIAEVLLRQNVPCLIEKPLAKSSGEAQSIKDISQETGTLCFPAHIMRFSKLHKELRTRFAQLGAAEPLRLVFHRDRSEALLELYPGDHPVLLTGIHDVDLAVWFTDSFVASVSAEEETNGGICTGYLAKLHHRSGAETQVRGSYNLPRDTPYAARDEVIIEDLDGTEVYRLIDDPGLTTNEGERNPALSGEISHFLDLIGGAARQPLVTLDEAIHNLAVVEAVLSSSRSGGMTVVVQASEATYQTGWFQSQKSL